MFNDGLCCFWLPFIRRRRFCFDVYSPGEYSPNYCGRCPYRTAVGYSSHAIFCLLVDSIFVDLLTTAEAPGGHADCWEHLPYAVVSDKVPSIRLLYWPRQRSNQCNGPDKLCKCLSVCPNSYFSKRLSVLRIVRPKCTLAASHAAHWRVTVSISTGKTDGRTDGHRIVTLRNVRFPLDATSGINDDWRESGKIPNFKKESKLI